jgi:hypothetical protein
MVWMALLVGARGAGVTLITHGQNGVVSEWVIPMADRVPLRPELPGTNYSAYTISLTRPGGTYVVTPTLRAGAAPTLTDSGEIIIAFDWSSLATSLFEPSTSTVASQIAAALLSTNFLPALGGRALAEFPLHLIGHSRGASLVAEMARVLGAQGLWVDQLSFNDPYPSGLAGDPGMKVYQNVLFTDNYWQTASFPDGEFVPGAYNRFLSALAGGNDSNHSDMHLWYHGTIDLATPTQDNLAQISGAERNTWYTPGEARGTNTGYALSRIAGGNRLANIDPAGTTTNRIRQGLNQRWDFGAGSVNNRAALPANNGAWPNPITLSFASGNTALPGQQVILNLTAQTGTNASSLLTLHVDNNANPWDGSTQIGSWNVPATGTAGVSALTLTQTVSGALSPGTYRLFARLTANGRTRYLPSALPLVVAPIQPPILASSLTNGSFLVQVQASSGATVVLQSSTNLLSWINLATNQSLSGPWSLAFPADQARQFFRALARPPE